MDSILLDEAAVSPESSDPGVVDGPAHVHAPEVYQARQAADGRPGEVNMYARWASAAPSGVLAPKLRNFSIVDRSPSQGQDSTLWVCPDQNPNRIGPCSRMRRCGICFDFPTARCQPSSHRTRPARPLSSIRHPPDPVAPDP